MGLLAAYAAWRNPFLLRKEKVTKQELAYDEQIY
jgi:hypothetical protein